MASPKKDKRRVEIARFLGLRTSLGVPDATSAEQAIWTICARHGTAEGATKALAALRRCFVDLNECRITKKSELGAMLRRFVKNDSYRVGCEVRGFLWRFHRDQHTMDYAVMEDLTLPQLRKYLENAEEFNREMALALFFHYCALETAAQAAAEVVEPVEGATDGPSTNGVDERPKKRTERELQAHIDRLRLLCTIAIYGKVPSQTKAAAAHRHFVKAWGYSAVVAQPKPKPKPGKVAAPANPPKGAAKKPDAKKAPAQKPAAKTTAASKGAAKKTTTKKTATKKAVSKKAPAKAKKASTKKAPTKKAPSKKAKKESEPNKGTKRGGDTSRPKTTRSKKGPPASRRSSRR